MSQVQQHTPRLGVCYYPEHWPEDNWAHDAQRMYAMGIRTVRIGEFAWSRLEATPGNLTLDWLTRAINTLHTAGLEIVLGTPSATPPRWMLDKYPDMLAVDEHGTPRGFGSRRHYCFSHKPYQQECERIVLELAKAYGEHPGVVAWQTDNEYGCHDTIPSYSNAALTGFQLWCAEQYGNIEALNKAWGNVFWSMEYNHFEQIGFPVAAVTETNPAHRLAFWRYSSHQVVVFNQLQTRILRQHSPGRDLIHNYMGNFVQFDHHAVSKDLDVASWDNYPLGFLTRDDYSDSEQATYLRTGHPDSSAFHHDLYRGCNNGRWWVMEQQPGPVNWAPYNPAPLAGMVRFWGWEAIAHGAEVVSYFRWRQCPVAQEQMHTGLCRADGSLDVGGEEVSLLGEELLALQSDSANTANTANSANSANSTIQDNIDNQTLFEQVQAPVALVFDYTGIEAQRIQQPDGKTFDPLYFAKSVYSAVRQLGLNIDIVASDADLSGYNLVLITSNTIDDDGFVDRLQQYAGTVVLMPRTGSKTYDNNLPQNLAPGAFQTLIPIKVHRSESLPSFVQMPTDKGWVAQHWRETIASELSPRTRFEDGEGFHYQLNQVHYLNACLTESSLIEFLEELFEDIGLAAFRLPVGVRTRTTRGAVWVFNFGPDPLPLKSLPPGFLSHVDVQSLILGEPTLSAGGVAIVRLVS